MEVALNMGEGVLSGESKLVSRVVCKREREGCATRIPADADVRDSKNALPKHLYPILSEQFKGEVKAF